jgi:hypothetical protein
MRVRYGSLGSEGALFQLDRVTQPGPILFFPANEACLARHFLAGFP